MKYVSVGVSSKQYDVTSVYATAMSVLNFNRRAGSFLIGLQFRGYSRSSSFSLDMNVHCPIHKSPRSVPNLHPHLTTNFFCIVLKLFNPGFSVQYVPLLQPTECTSSYTGNRTDITPTSFGINMPFSGCLFAKLKTRNS